MVAESFTELMRFNDIFVHKLYLLLFIGSVYLIREIPYLFFFQETPGNHFEVTLEFPYVTQMKTTTRTANQSMENPAPPFPGSMDK
jgi:multidrug efflux pump subunit AcrB